MSEIDNIDIPRYEQGEKMPVTIYIPSVQVDAMDALALMTESKRSAMFRVALSEWFENHPEALEALDMVTRFREEMSPKIGRIIVDQE